MATLTKQRRARQMPAPERGCADPGLSFRAFVPLIAAIMACNAFGIDSMLAALPEIGRALAVRSENERQWIIAIYLIGFGAAQLIYGPLSDHYGRRPILLGSLVLFTLTSIFAGLATTFPMMLVARLLQGIASAASRVLVVSIVRDCFHGRQMARVMSLTFIVFLAVPIIAPSLGQAILLVASWRMIFFALAGFTAAVALLAGLLLNETLHPDLRTPASARGVVAAFRLTLSVRVSIGYTLATTLVYGSLTAYINSVQQIFADIFDRPRLFPIMFACVAGSMGVAAFINSRVVERLGTRRVSHAALLGFIGFAALHVAVSASGRDTMWAFSILQCMVMFCFGLMGANFSSMAMEPMGEIAGTASSAQGFISTCGGALIGLVIGQAFDGTTLPLTLGFLCLGLGALGIVFVTERGRLFRPLLAAAA